jgi:phenylacetate-CoA ligase
MRHVIGDFLKAHPEFTFNVVEHLEGWRVIGAARETFDAFVLATSTAVPDDTPWVTRRNELHEAVHDIPAYAGVDWSRPDYEATIPLIDKSALRLQPESFISPRADRAHLWSRPTSGTSGPPVTLLYSAEHFASFQYFSACKLAWHAGLLDEGMLARPVFCLAILDNRYLEDRVWADPSEYSGLTLRVVFDEGAERETERLLDLVQTHTPSIVTLSPRILAVLLNRLAGRTDCLVDSTRLVISGGSNLDEALRRRAEAALGIPVIDAYGMTEVGEVASHCCERDGLHLHETSLIAEVRSDDGRLGRTGTGELIVSSIMNRAMPLLRYRTGDFVEITNAPCRCGRAGRRITRLAGREVHPFLLSDGTYFAPTHLNGLFKLYPIREFQVTQLSADRIEVQVEMLAGTLGRTTILLSILEHVAAELSGRAAVEVIEAKFPLGEKFQRYRCLVAPKAPLT